MESVPGSREEVDDDEAHDAVIASVFTTLDSDIHVDAT